MSAAFCIGDNCLDYAGDSNPCDQATSHEHNRHIQFVISNLKPWNC